MQYEPKIHPSFALTVNNYDTSSEKKSFHFFLVADEHLLSGHFNWLGIDAGYYQILVLSNVLMHEVVCSFSFEVRIMRELFR